MIFNKSGKVIRKYIFRYNDHVLEITNKYKYLGILFKPSDSFTKATELWCKKAKQALFCIYKTLNSDKLNISSNLKLFDSCVKPTVYITLL